MRTKQDGVLGNPCEVSVYFQTADVHCVHIITAEKS